MKRGQGVASCVFGPPIKTDIFATHDSEHSHAYSHDILKSKARVSYSRLAGDFDAGSFSTRFGGRLTEMFANFVRIQRI